MFKSCIHHHLLFMSLPLNLRITAFSSLISDYENTMFPILFSTKKGRFVQPSTQTSGTRGPMTFGQVFLSLEGFRDVAHATAVLGPLESTPNGEYLTPALAS